MKDQLGEWGEKRLVEGLPGLLGSLPNGVVGAGDDAAILPVVIGNSVAVSTDRIPSDLLALRMGLMAPSDLGRYIIEVNASDLAAMGAKPTAFLLNLSFPSSTLVDEYYEIVKGAAKRSAELGACIVGGDTKTSAEPNYVGIGIGTLSAGRQVLRGTARPGDALYVTGPIGGFGAALAYFSRSDQSILLPEQDEQCLLRKLVRPTARVDLADRLADFCTACIDITDGLSQSIQELQRSSECEFDVDAASLPKHPLVDSVAKLLGLSDLDIAFGIGLDLELLCCAAPDNVMPGYIKIGEARDKTGVGARLKLDGGEYRSLPGEGFEHFSKDALAYVAKPHGAGRQCPHVGEYLPKSSGKHQLE